MPLFGLFGPPNIEKLKERRDVNGLLKALKHKSGPVRYSAIRALGELKDPRAVEPLIGAMKPLITALGDWDHQVGIDAVQALGWMGDAGLEPLIDALRYGRPHVAESAAHVLGERADPRVIDALADAAGGTDYRVSSTAALILKNLGEPAVEPLIRALAWRTTGATYVASALGDLGDVRAVEALIAALKDGGWDLRQAAAEALGKLGDLRAVEPLRVAEEDEASQVRKAAGLALARRAFDQAVRPRKPVATESIIRALEHPDRNVRQSAAAALATAKDTRAVVPLMAALKDKERGVRQRAARALGRLGDPRAEEPLIAALKDKYVIVRRVAVEALGKLPRGAGSQGRLEAIVGVLTDKGVRDEAESALVRLKDSRSVELLLPALEREEAGVRYSAAFVLGKVGDRRVVEPLIATLKDKDRRVRSKAALSLVERKYRRAVEPVMAALKNNRLGVSREAVRALAELQESGTVESLLVALRDVLRGRVPLGGWELELRKNRRLR